MRISFTALTGQGPRDVVIELDSEATVGAVARSLFAVLDGKSGNSVPNPRSELLKPRFSKDALASPFRSVGGGEQRSLWMDGRMLDPRARAVRELRDGAVVSVEKRTAAATVLSEPTGLVEVRVVSGPAAGPVHRLGLGASTLGSGDGVDLVIGDPSVPDRALRITVGRAVVDVLPFGEGALLDGQQLTSETRWPVGGMLAVGSSILTLATSTTPDTRLEQLPDGGLAFDRPPRHYPAERERLLEAPEPPERVGGRMSYNKALKEYQREVAEFDARLDQLRREDQAERRALHPDPAEVLLAATGPRRRLWERRLEDDDTLQLRLGLADLPAHIELGEAQVPTAHLVPVALPLGSLGVIGLTGPSRALARWLVAQAAVLHSPRDLAIVVLSTDKEAGAAWNWVRWLPHCAPREGEDCTALVGTDPESAANRLTELAARRRSEAVPYNVLIVLDGARALRGVPGLSMLLSHGPEYGLYAICMDDEEQQLPEECAAVATLDGVTVDLPGQGFGPILADQVSPSWADRVARALAPIRDVSRKDAAETVPSEVRLLDLLDLSDPTAELVLNSWTRTGGRTTRVPIGVGPNVVHHVDLQTDGLHGLVAENAKAELLQTLIASLAVANRPDEMAFLLVDYQGSRVFEDCVQLPHTVGVVNELDGHATERALESLSAELRRREEMLLEAGAKDIDEYNDLRTRENALPPMTRLVIVIDELAAMVTELPDFGTGLVDLGRRGRSLGVHLCYVRSDASEPHGMRPARVNGRRPSAVHESSATALAVPWEGLGHPLPSATADDAPVTDLTVLVQAVSEAARRIGVGRQPSPWLTPLPDQVRVDPRTAAGGSVVDVPIIPFGITDLPAVQSREPLTLDLANGGHLFVAGSAQSGRSTALQTIAGSLAGACTPYDVHLYAIDCGADALLPLVSLPHCGAVVTRDQPDRCERLLTALSAEVARRRQLLAGAGFASLREQRASVAATDRLPWMVLLLDRWEAFGHDLADTVLRLLQEGASVGLRAVFTGDRSGLTDHFDRHLVLSMDDPNDYRHAGIQEKQVPASMPPGRALEISFQGLPPRESQIAVLSDDASGTAQVAALQEIARASVTRYGRLPRRQRPIRVDELPGRVTYQEAMALDADFLAPSALWALVGVGGDTLTPVGIDLLNEGPGFVVAGPARSGRSTTLRTIVHSLLDPAVAGGLVPVVLVTPRHSPLRLLEGRPGVLGVLTSDSGDLRNAIGDEHRYVVVVDDAELLDGTALDEALRDILRTAQDGEHAVVIGGTTQDLGRGNWGFVSGVLLSADSPDDGALLGLSLPRNASHSANPGRGLFVASGTATGIQVALPPQVSEDSADRGSAR